MSGNEGIESSMHALRCPDPAVQTQSNPQSLDLLVKGPKRAFADILIAKIGRHHNADEPEVLYGAACLFDRRVDVMEGNHSNAFQASRVRRAKFSEPVIVGAGDIDR